MEIGHLTAVLYSMAEQDALVQRLIPGAVVSDPRELYILNSGPWRSGKRLILNARRFSWRASGEPPPLVRIEKV